MNKINLVLLKKIGSPIYSLQFDEKKIYLFFKKGINQVVSELNECTFLIQFLKFYRFF